MKEKNQYSAQIKFYTGNPKWWENVLFKKKRKERISVQKVSE